MYELIHIHTNKKKKKKRQPRRGVGYLRIKTENQHKIKFNKKMVCNYSMKQNDGKFVFVIFRVIARSPFIDSPCIHPLY